MPNKEIQILYQKVANIIKNELGLSLLLVHWEVGRIVVNYKATKQHQEGMNSPLLRKLASLLSQQFGGGFRHKSLHQMCLFYHAFPIREQLQINLKWTHYQKLISLESPEIRLFYAAEIVRQKWSIRQLMHHIKADYYTQMKKNKTPNATPVHPTLIKNPYMLQLLKIPYPIKKTNPDN